MRAVFILISAAPLVLGLAGILEFVTGLSLRDPSPSWSKPRAIVRFLLPASFLVMIFAIAAMVFLGGLSRAGLL